MDSYLIDPGASRFLVQAFATGMLSAMGHSPTVEIREFSGTASYVQEAPQQSSLEVRINAASLAVTGAVSDKDRREMERTMNEQVLEIARYPEILYRSSKISIAGGRADISGELALHGVTRRQDVSARVVFAGDTLRANGEFMVSQSAYNIRPVRVAGGMLRLKDELKCLFEIVGRRKTESVPGVA